MDLKEVHANADALAKHLAKEMPTPLGAIVILLDRSTTGIVMTTARLSPDLTNVVLRAVLDGRAKRSEVQG